MRKQQFVVKLRSFLGNMATYFHKSYFHKTFFQSHDADHLIETLDLLPHIFFFKWYFEIRILKFDAARDNFSKSVSHKKLITIR